MSMGDVIQSVEDYEKWDVESTYGDGEALVDNWEPVKVWYKSEYDQTDAWQAAQMLGKRFNKRVAFQHVDSDVEQWEYTDFVGEAAGWEPEGEWP